MKSMIDHRLSRQDHLNPDEVSIVNKVFRILRWQLTFAGTKISIRNEIFFPLTSLSDKYPSFVRVECASDMFIEQIML